MAGSKETYLRGAHFEHPSGDQAPRAFEHARHKANHARPAPHPSTGFTHIDPRVGAPKNDHHAPIHGGMHTRAKTGDHLAFAGGNIKSALESGAVGPSIGDHLSGYPKPHDGGAAPIHPSMASAAKRSVVPVDVMHELGRKILATAVGPNRDGTPRVRK